MSYKEIEGNLFDELDNFDVIAQGNNCFCVQGAGIAPQFVKRFKTNEYPMEALWTEGDYNKMGQIEALYHSRDGKYGLRDVRGARCGLAVVNCYTQYHYFVRGLTSPILIDYDALRLCMRKIAHQFKGERIGLPAIGAGLAGGDWEVIKKIFQEELATDCDVTVVIYKP